MAKFTQENRHVKITTPLGTDKLLVSAMNGSEAISQLFNFELSLFSEDQGIPFADIIGKGVTVAVELPSGGDRYVNGIISSFSQVSGEGASSDDSTRVAHYRATLVPKFWLLTRSAELRIFQNMTVPEIVEKVLKQFGITDFDLKLQGSYDKREYCVQYRESHFNFISRLLEEEGIFFFFAHNATNHRLVIADSPQANAPCPGQSSASYQIQGSTPDDDTISSLEKMQSILPGKYMLSDFNFETPNNSLNVTIPGKYKIGPGDREIYDYPGGYMTKAPGDKLVRVRMEEEETQVTTVRGSGCCRSFTAGYRFTLLNADRKDMNDKEFILTSIAHTVSQSVQEGGAFTYHNSFTCIPADVPFRPPRLTPKPFVQGAQTAIVVGPSGEEIYTDKFGRVKVQFHWDREGKRDESSSCWIRVSQLWAGTGWGAMYIPRIGQEVIVDFLEGDPDCPIITGRVYHGTNMPPYNLPAEKTKSTIKSNSSLGGGGFNEFRFEDKKGNEEIFLHGQKDWTIQILNDKNQTIGHNETLDVGNDRTKNVKNNQSESIGVNKSITVGKNHTESITENASVDIGKNETVSVGENTSVTIGKNFTEDIGEKSNSTIGKDMSISVGKNSSTQVGENMTVDVGKNLVIQAADSVTIMTGDASITMKKNGAIIISGKDITLNGSGKINIKADGNVVVKGSKIMSN
ncbi:MAG TPA: type VI secretion system tip protein VgrG [Desulfuromonadales bacterium]|nr:type VI secretion system tip protein VgrG [Desulfuromonadales bacterium]